MKMLLAAAIFAAVPLAAHADCSVKDFSVQDFKVVPSGPGRPMHMPGNLVNNCSSPAAAQVEIMAKDGSGKVIEKRKGWPAGTSNIAPGKSLKFDMGRRFRFRSTMQAYTLKIVSVRSW